MLQKCGNVIVGACVFVGVSVFSPFAKLFFFFFSFFTLCPVILLSDYSKSNTVNFGYESSHDNARLKPMTGVCDLEVDLFQDHFIVVEEELLLAPDFLSFLAQCFNAFNSDPTLLAVSAWNFNGE